MKSDESEAAELRGRVINPALSALQSRQTDSSLLKHTDCAAQFEAKKIALLNCCASTERFIFHVGKHHLIKSRKRADCRYSFIYICSNAVSVFNGHVVQSTVCEQRINIDFQ